MVIAKQRAARQNRRVDQRTSCVMFAGTRAVPGPSLDGLFPPNAGARPPFLLGPSTALVPL